jgi:hypothetical protein
VRESIASAWARLMFGLAGIGVDGAEEGRSERVVDEVGPTIVVEEDGEGLTGYRDGQRRRKGPTGDGKGV